MAQDKDLDVLGVSERMRSTIQSSNFVNIWYISFSATGGSCRARSGGEAAGQRP